LRRIFADVAGRKASKGERREAAGKDKEGKEGEGNEHITAAATRSQVASRSFSLSRGESPRQPSEIRAFERDQLAGAGSFSLRYFKAVICRIKQSLQSSLKLVLIWKDSLIYPLMQLFQICREYLEGRPQQARLKCA
jgi:hypothetical protein